MKQNYKIKVFGLSCFVCGLLSLGFLISPIRVFADTPLGGTCSYNTDCATGLFCDTLHGNTCESVVSGTPCTTNNDCWTSKTGLACLSSQCVVPNATGASQPTGYTNCLEGGDPEIPTGNQIQCAQKYGNPSGTQPLAPTTQSGIPCPANLTSVNGVCLPPSEYTTGIAASTSLTGFVLALVKILLSFAGLIAVVMLVLGGYWYMAAGGNEEMSEKGKKTIINFVMGLVVVILAYTIVSIIASTLTGGDRLIQ
jgi:hypothetical protein